MRRLLTASVIVVGCSSPPMVEGSARLPECSQPPATDLTGTWFDQGTVTITTTGCEDQGAAKGESFQSCPLNWVVTQDGNAVTLIVDEEYEVHGRICGDTLHLQGGWWLPVQDENGRCNYDDDDGEEVGIESEGASLQWSMRDGAEALNGALVVRGACAAEYAVTLSKL
jgi:hypothetical protein